MFWSRSFTVMAEAPVFMCACVCSVGRICVCCVFMFACTWAMYVVWCNFILFKHTFHFRCWATFIYVHWICVVQVCVPYVPLLLRLILARGPQLTRRYRNCRASGRQSLTRDTCFAPGHVGLRYFGMFVYCPMIILLVCSRPRCADHSAVRIASPHHFCITYCIYLYMFMQLSLRG